MGFEKFIHENIFFSPFNIFTTSIFMNEISRFYGLNPASSVLVYGWSRFLFLALFPTRPAGCLVRPEGSKISNNWMAREPVFVRFRLIHSPNDVKLPLTRILARSFIHETLRTFTTPTNGTAITQAERRGEKNRAKMCFHFHEWNITKHRQMSNDEWKNKGNEQRSTTYSM